MDSSVRHRFSTFQFPFHLNFTSQHQSLQPISFQFDFYSLHYSSFLFGSNFTFVSPLNTNCPCWKWTNGDEIGKILWKNWSNFKTMRKIVWMIIWLLFSIAFLDFHSTLNVYWVGRSAHLFTKWASFREIWSVWGGRQLEIDFNSNESLVGGRWKCIFLRSWHVFGVNCDQSTAH